jgi:hypothetical protein
MAEGAISHNEFSLVCITGRGGDDRLPRDEVQVGNRVDDRESGRRDDPIVLFVGSAQGRCDSLSTTQRFEQHDWMQLKHKSPELMRKSRAGIATVGIYFESGASQLHLGTMKLC